MPTRSEIKNFRLDEYRDRRHSDSQLQERGALQLSGDAFHALADTMPQMVWSTLPDGDHDYYNARWYEFTGAPAGSTDGEAWADMFHPDDQPEAWRRWKLSLATGEPYEVEYRLRHRSGQYRWVLGRALPIIGPDQKIQRWIGTCTDIEDAKQIASHNEILSQELSHRIKNIFAIISGLVSMTLRGDEKLAAMADTLKGRIAALGRAHEYVRPHNDKPEGDSKEVTIRHLLSEIFASYPAFTDQRLTISGGDIVVSDRAATPVALVFHELATNSMKYGALAAEHGRVDVVISPDGGMLRFNWTESGGAAISGAPARSGFGSKLVDMSVTQQLGGSLERSWLPTGLQIMMEVQASRLAR
ncbi:PAS domain-containing protein [Parasphingorhabdus flavimaris]|uniref:histidine kinase n=1 Tax=Parasphingorhabdus flavimaris TaxID=266812 RepID=A0ABX2N4L4_9SPHN|nr:PAS domain-containing protein [Parasphingorhabdus flavimaris]NVD28651.1 PAS domain-containing protein [Parasphingorhabdus flavimaris]|tara:strand:- start:528 stop:1601 length:1074 start_codon:yes stop_codon:yes gene_type:complete